MRDRDVWLIGMMGSGKSTVGRIVAERLERGFVDLDLRVEEMGGRPAAALVAADEPGFRRLEASAVAAVAGSGAVVATGGGVVLDDGSVAAMRASGVVVWLAAPVEVLELRVAGGEGRPLLGSEPGRDLGALLGERRERYASAAHAVVDAAQRPDSVADAVIEAVT